MKAKLFLSISALAGVLLVAGTNGAWSDEAAGGGPLWAQASVAGFDRAAAIKRIDAALQAADDISERSYRLWKRSIKGEDVKAERAALPPPADLMDLKEDALRVIKADPADEAALRAMRVVFSTYYPPTEDAPEAQLRAHVQRLLMEHHLNRPYLLKTAERMALSGSDTAFWQTVHDRSSNPQVRGNAAAVLLEDRVTRLGKAVLSAQESAEVRKQGMGYAQEIKDKYSAVPVGPMFVLPRYMDKYTSTLGDFVKNRETILAYSVGAQLPSIKVADLEGRMDELGNYRGKVLVVDFWATWCGPCKAGHPDLVALDKEMAGRPFEIIGISVDDKPADVVRYMKEKLDLPWVQWHIGPVGKLLEEWGVQGFPTYLVVDANGVVRERTNHLNEKSKADIRALVKQQEG